MRHRFFIQKIRNLHFRPRLSLYRFPLLLLLNRICQNILELGYFPLFLILYNQFENRIFQHICNFLRFQSFFTAQNTFLKSFEIRFYKRMVHGCDFFIDFLVLVHFDNSPFHHLVFENDADEGLCVDCEATY